MDELNNEQAAGQPEEILSGADNPGSSPIEMDSPANPGKLDWLSATSAVINGLGIGLLLGILLGLSISAVVSAVIGTLSGILALLLGLNEKYLDPLKSIRIGSFGLFAVVGIILGLYMRANDPFAPSLKDKMSEYTSIGYHPDEARAFITHQIQSDSTKARREASVLYSSKVDAGSCELLQYATADQPLPELVNTFKEAGGTWKELAIGLSKDLPGSLAAISLISLRDCFCSLATEGTLEFSNQNQIGKLNKGDSLETIEKTLSGAGTNWQAVVRKFSDNVPESQRKEVYLSVIKVLAHD